jgi:hypothetical protein
VAVESPLGDKRVSDHVALEDEGRFVLSVKVTVILGRSRVDMITWPSMWRQRRPRATPPIGLVGVIRFRSQWVLNRSERMTKSRDTALQYRPGRNVHECGREV